VGYPDHHLLRLPDRLRHDLDHQPRQSADLERPARRRRQRDLRDTSTNRLASTTWSNIYRVLDTALTDTQRPIMADVVTVGTT